MWSGDTVPLAIIQLFRNPIESSDITLSVYYEISSVYPYETNSISITLLLENGLCSYDIDWGSVCNFYLNNFS